MNELRTLLTVIQGNLRAIFDDVYALDKAEVATIYGRDRDAEPPGRRPARAGAGRAGQLNLAPHPTDVAPLVEAAMVPFAAQAAAQQVALTVDVPPMQADPDRVRQVLHNLLANALRYTPAGGEIVLSATLEMEAES
jgi:signal transduction histidine kinase